MQEHTPSETPNAVIENPTIRRAMNYALSGIGILLTATMVVDLADPRFDLTDWTVPAFTGYAFLSGLFGLSVINPNIPKKD